jgi:type I restriction enzyme S subunit
MMLTFNKSNWKSYKLGDLVEWYQKDIPNSKQIGFGIKYYVTAEHIDSDSIKFNRYNELVDGQKGPTITKHFEKGDLLLSTRSVALRKAAISPISGVTGEKLLVLRVKNNSELLESLFPYVFKSNQFWKFAQNSASGSVNKFTSWTKLREYEFLLPPKAEQARLAELLWALDDVIEKEKLLLDKLKRSDLCQLKHYFYDDQKSDRIKLKNIVSLKKGKKPDTLNETGEGLPYCTAKYLRTNEIESVVPESTINKAFLIDDTDIIILWDGSNAGEMLRGKKGVLASTMCKLVLKDKSFNIDYVFQFLRFRSNDIRRATVGSAIPHVDPGMIENIEIPVLEMKNQKGIVTLFNNILSNINLLDSKISASQSLQKSLINEIF